MENFTTLLQQSLNDAQVIAIDNENQSIEPEHLLLAMLQQKESSVCQLIKQNSTNIEKLQADLEKKISQFVKVTESNGGLVISGYLNKILLVANKFKKDFSDSYLSSELVFLAMSSVNGNIKKLLTKHDLNEKELRQFINTIRNGQSVDDAGAENQDESLKKYTIDFTDLARKGKLDPVIGRDEEIRRAIQILQRRRKNNPVLIGDPGVGKTTIIEGLAQRIVNREVPESLCDKQLLSLDLGSLLAGAKYRGEFEERLKNVLKEISNCDGNIILFIDELHTLVGVGGAEGAIDAGNMLKPALARGELHCIGATTIDEYRQYIEKDAALERRFQRILVEEPSENSAIAILRGLKEKYEIHHGITITDAAIIASVNLSQRYITDRFLPDKAIDLIDEAASRLKMEIDSKPEAIDRIDRKLIQLKIEQQALKKEKDMQSIKRLSEIGEKIAHLEKESADLEEIWSAEKIQLEGSKNIKESLDQAKTDLEKAKRENDLAKASELMYGTIPNLEKQIANIAKDDRHPKSPEKESSTLVKNAIGEEEIAQILSRATGIPIKQLNQDERLKINQMESLLQQQVVGQNEAISAVSNAIRRSRSGLADPEKPTASFLFLGPTGVGKTELTKALANYLFDSEEQIIRIDMSEYMEKFSTTRLIGSPPGYVGYEEGGVLTEAVRKKPYSIVLFDEVEKAHPDVFNLLLQVLDDGRLTDSHGKVVNFKNTVIIMTSNLGSQKLQKISAEQTSYDDMVRVANDAVGQFFRPEFINRIDEIVVFHPLSKENISDIIDIQLKQLNARLFNQRLSLQLDKKAKNYITNKGYDINFGARPLKRAIQNHLENPLSVKLINSEFNENDIISAKYDEKKGGLDFKTA